MPGHKRREALKTARAERGLRQYHRIVIEFGKDALGDTDLQSLLKHAIERVSRGMGIRRAKVLEYRPDSDDLLVRAGVGWQPGVVGHAVLPSDMASPPGRAFRTGEPVYIDNLPANPEFVLSDLLRDHGIVSLINVPIVTGERVWGVLEVDSEQERHFDRDDEEFLAGFASVLGRAMENEARRAEDAAAHLERRMLLEEREVLFRELQHRVANNFQTVVGLLELSSRKVVDPTARQEIEKVLDRVTSIVLAHERLSLRAIEKDISLAPYLVDLCENIRGPENVRIKRSIRDATVPVRTAVRLGLILNELLTNCLKHAFDETGGIIKVSFSVNPDRGEGRLVVADSGRGMAPSPQSGSGLALILSLVAQIGGTLTQTSAPGKGTSFTTTFPLAV